MPTLQNRVDRKADSQGIIKSQTSSAIICNYYLRSPHNNSHVRTGLKKLKKWYINAIPTSKRKDSKSEASPKNDLSSSSGAINMESRSHGGAGRCSTTIIITMLRFNGAYMRPTLSVAPTVVSSVSSMSIQACSSRCAWPC